MPLNSLTYNSNKEQPDYITQDWKHCLKILEFVEDIYQGKARWFDESTNIITNNEKANRYLPKEADEYPEAYRGRLMRSRFDRKFREAIRESANYLHEISINEDTPKEIIELLDDIDLNGNNLKNFLKIADIQALKDGGVGILLDAPSENSNVNNRIYLCMIALKNIVNWKEEIIDGKKILSQITIQEAISVNDGTFGTSSITQYRVIRPGEYEIWTKTKDKLTLTHSGNTSFKEIPFLLYQIDPDGKGLSTDNQPPLIDLASLNLVHYRKLSNNDELIRKCTIPVFVVNHKESGGMIGGDMSVGQFDAYGNSLPDSNNLPKNTTSIGANTVLYDVDAKFVEPSGQSMVSIRQDIQDVELAIEAKKNSFQLGHSQPLTAEEVIRVSSSNDVNITTTAKTKENVIAQIFKLMGRYLNLNVNKCGGATVSLEEIRKLQSRANQEYYNMLLNHGVITPEQLAKSIAKNLPIQDVIEPGD